MRGRNQSKLQSGGGHVALRSPRTARCLAQAVFGITPCMDPDGVDYPNKTLYHEVEYCKKLVYDHGGYDDRPPLFRVTVEFSEVDGKTRMEMTATCPTAEEAAQMRKFIKAAGGNSTWDRLAEYLNEDGERSQLLRRE